MNDPSPANVREHEPDPTVLIVVGAHPEAELHDRPLAYRLREAILAELRHAEDPVELDTLVLTDLWYLNQNPLRSRPTVAIGRPEINAATAWMARRLPTAFLVEDAFRIQLDPEFIELKSCLWGPSPRTTSDAVDCFLDRYVVEYLSHVRMALGRAA